MNTTKVFNYFETHALKHLENSIHVYNYENRYIDDAAQEKPRDNDLLKEKTLGNLYPTAGDRPLVSDLLNLNLDFYKFIYFKLLFEKHSVE